MADRVVSFPIPVLWNGDDIAGEVPAFEFECVRQKSNTSMVLTLTPAPLACGNETIETLVASGKAGWCLQMHCTRTYYRKEQFLDTNQPQVGIPLDRVEGQLRCNLYIIARTAIHHYRPAGIHSDYGDAKFEVESGDVLAIGPEFEIQVEPLFDAMSAPVSSLIRFQRMEVKEGELDVDFDADLITVNVPERDWIVVNSLKADAPNLLHACLATPVLQEAISRRGEFLDRKWAGRLSSMLNARQIVDRDPYVAAQKLLSQPVYRGLSEVNELLLRSDA